MSTARLFLQPSAPTPDLEVQALMNTRRLVALIIFVAAAFLAAKTRHGDFLGMLDPVIFLIAVLVAIIALGAFVFNVPLGPPNYTDSGFGMHEPVGKGLGKLGLLVFAAAPLFIAVRGIYRGVIPSLISDQDVVFGQAPIDFLANLGIWVCLGGAVLFLIHQVSASDRARSKRRRRR